MRGSICHCWQFQEGWYVHFWWSDYYQCKFCKCKSHLVEVSCIVCTLSNIGTYLRLFFSLNFPHICIRRWPTTLLRIVFYQLGQLPLPLTWAQPYTIDLVWCVDCPFHKNSVYLWPVNEALCCGRFIILLFKCWYATSHRSHHRHWKVLNVGPNATK